MMVEKTRSLVGDLTRMPKIIGSMICKDSRANILRACESMRAVGASQVVCSFDRGDPMPDEADWPAYVVLDTDHWVDFGVNQTYALRCAEYILRILALPGYILVCDSDDFFTIDGPLDLSSEADAYDIEVVSNGISYWKPLLLKAGVGWRFEGVIHHYATRDAPARIERLHNVKYHRSGASDRGPDKFKRNAAILYEEYQKNPHDSRTVFYLAESYKDAGEYLQAMHWYTLRVRMAPQCREEVYLSYLYRAQCAERLMWDWTTIISLYSIACNVDTMRPEAWLAMATIHKERGDRTQCVYRAEEALKLAGNTTREYRLFRDPLVVHKAQALLDWAVT